MVISTIHLRLIVYNIFSCRVQGGKNSRIFQDKVDQTFPVTEYAEIDN
jgi:hypothetical protein